MKARRGLPGSGQTSRGGGLEDPKVRALGLWLRGRNGSWVFVPCSGLLQWDGWQGGRGLGRGWESTWRCTCFLCPHEAPRGAHRSAEVRSLATTAHFPLTELCCKGSRGGRSGWGARGPGRLKGAADQAGLQALSIVC